MVGDLEPRHGGRPHVRTQKGVFDEITSVFADH